MNAIKRNYIVVSVIWILSSYACSNSIDKISNDQQNGIVPSSIEQVIDVFELKYGEIKECNYDGQLIKFSITNVEDSIMLINETDYVDPDAADRIRMHAFLSIEIGENISQLKVSSSKWGPYYEYNNDGSDVQQIWDLLSSQLSAIDPQSFVAVFGEGALIKNTSFSIFMAKAYPFACKLSYDPPQNMYKFIFIITNQKSQ